MALDTYSDLKTSLVDHLDRDDLTTQVDNFIQLAEARHRRDIRIREMIKRAQTTAEERFLSLPDRFLEMFTIRLLTDPVTVLEEVNFDTMNRERRETPKKPSLYTIHSVIEFDRVPDEPVTAEMVYFEALTPLSDASPTNVLLTRAPDAYLYGALVASAPFLMHDERVQMWAELYSTARDTLNALDRRARHPGPLVSRTTGATP